MEYTREEIATIITETISETTQDILDLKNRRPEIYFFASLTYDLIEYMVNERKSNLVHPGEKMRGLRSDTLSQCIEKAENLKREKVTHE